jgi:TIR domain
MLVALATSSVPAREVKVLSSDASADAGRIFISYRRDDADFAAGWLSDRLVERYGADRVFEDVHSIQLGADFVEVIVAAVQSCAVVLALIGKRWLVDENRRRRLDKPDFVRLEIRTALKRNVTVIPVLLDGVQMPDAADLPPDLKELAHKHAVDLHAARFEADNEPLLSRLDEILASAASQSPAVQASNLPTLVSGSALPGSKGNSGDSVGRVSSNLYAEVAERQAAIQADLTEAQVMAGNSNAWVSSAQKMWQQHGAEIVRDLEAENAEDVPDYPSESSRGQPAPPGPPYLE